MANNAYAPRGRAFLDPRYTELGRAQEVFDRELGVCPTYFRPPAGRHTPLMARVVRRYGMSMVTWDVRVADRRADSPRKLARLALDRIRAGRSSSSPSTPRAASPPEVGAALPLVLRGLKGLDLDSVRLDHMLGTEGYAGRCTKACVRSYQAARRAISACTSPAKSWRPVPPWRASGPDHPAHGA